MKKSIALVFIICFIFEGCQKDFSVDIVQTTSTSQTLVNDSNLLSMYVLIDTTAPIHLDTLSKAVYTYDNLKRLIKYDWIDYTNGVVASPVDTRWKNLYYYNGADTLPYMEIDSSFEVGNVTTETIFHTYLNGQILLDSSSTGYVNKYTHLQSKTIDTVIGYNFPSPPFVRRLGYKVTYRQFANFNLITEKDSLFNADYSTTPFSYSYYLVDNRTSTYDNFLNPLIKFKNISPFPYDGYFPKLNDFESQGKNNIVDFVEVRRGASGAMNDLDEHIVNSYIYNNNGLPKIAKNGNLSIASPVKAFYYYTN